MVLGGKFLDVNAGLIAPLHGRSTRFHHSPAESLEPSFFVLRRCAATSNVAEISRWKIRTFNWG